MFLDEEGPQVTMTEFRIRSEMGQVATAQYWIMRCIAQSGCVRGEEDDVELALHEALVNAAVHGNHLDPRKWVHVKCRCEPGLGVSIVVRDEGEGFNEFAVPDPTSDAGLLREHGRGVFLMRACMNEVRFEKRGREVHLRKRHRDGSGAMDFVAHAALRTLPLEHPVAGAAR